MYYSFNLGDLSCPAEKKEKEKRLLRTSVRKS